MKLWKLLWHPWNQQLDPFDWHKFILSLITKSGTVHFLLTPCYRKRTRFDVCLWIPPRVAVADLYRAVQSIKAVAQTLGGTTLTTVAFEKDRKKLEAVGFTWIKRQDPLLSKEISTK